MSLLAVQGRILIMHTSKGMTRDDAASIDMYNPKLLNLLAVREVLQEDPAPYLPRVTELPSCVRASLDQSEQGLGKYWRDHWDAVLNELVLPKATYPAGGWAPWPAALPAVSHDQLSEWQSELPKPPRGIPLGDHPSYQYYLARVASGYRLPARLVVLPLAGAFSYRYSDTIGLVSAEQFLNNAHPRFGFLAA